MRFRLGAVVALAVAAGLILWLALRDTGGSSSTNSSATAVSTDQLRTLASSVNHPIFWDGPKQGFTYELTQLPTGAIYVRYLPSGAKVGSKDRYTTVATYPFRGAYTALQAVAKKSDSAVFKLPNGGLAVFSKSQPENVHVAYPNVDYQVEVFDPDPGQASVAARRLTAFGKLPTPSGATSAKPVAASVAALKALPNQLGHPIYWIGPRSGYTYELTRTTNGNVYVRYLPSGVAVGASRPYLTIATYPFQGAFEAITRLTRQKDQVAIKLKGGGVAVINPSDPKSIHLAYPGSDFEAEVFDPSAGRARQIVSSDQVEPIG